MDLTKIQFERLSNAHDLSQFSCSVQDLTDFLRDDALEYQERYLAATTLMVYEKKIVCYFSCSCDILPLSKLEKRQADLGFAVINEFPALKIGRLATCDDYEGQGLGTRAVQQCVGLALALNDHIRKDGIGCRFITVDALPEAIGFYEKLGFVPNEETRKKKTTSMRFDLTPIKDIVQSD